MAVSIEDIKKLYPLPVYNYKVSIDGETIAFSQVTGLSMSYATSMYKESPTEAGAPGPVVRRVPSQPADVTITLQKGVVRGKSVATLFNWINSKRLNLIQKKDIRIDLCDENGDATISWTVHNAFPTKLDAPSFDANNNDAAVESLQLMADQITIEEV